MDSARSAVDTLLQKVSDGIDIGTQDLTVTALADLTGQAGIGGGVQGGVSSSTDVTVHPTPAPTETPEADASPDESPAAEETAPPDSPGVGGQLHRNVPARS